MDVTDTILGAETPWLQVVWGRPTDDELAALVAVLSLARIGEQAVAEVPRATMVMRRTGRAHVGRHAHRAPRVSRSRWRSASRGPDRLTTTVTAGQSRRRGATYAG